MKGYGTYEQWLFGMVWVAWLGFLCVKDTAPDYMHLVKQFGIIGSSQLPLHFLLAMKQPYSPLRLVLHTSQRQLISLHMVSGRIINGLITVHATLYVKISMQSGIFGKSIWQLKIAVALISLAIFGTITLTSLEIFRRRAYWWFYKIHIVGSAAVLPLLFFHVHHIRIHVLECAAVIGLNALIRIVGR